MRRILRDCARGFQPMWIKRAYPAEYSYCHLRFHRPGESGGLPYSEIWGIPQGGDVIRQHTGSGLFIDEAAFQPDLESALGAAQPMLKGGGRLDIVSSAEPGYFEELVEDRVVGRLGEGLVGKRQRLGVVAAREAVHFFAHRSRAA